MAKVHRYCPNFKGVARADAGEKALIAPLRCKQWDCPYCAPVNAKIWQARLLNAISGIDKNETVSWSFVTITLPPEIHAIESRFERVQASIEFIKQRWDKLQKRLKRWLGYRHYVRVVEQHASGVLHIHLLIGASVPDAELCNHTGGDKAQYWHSDTLQTHAIECGFGYIHDARNLDAIREQKQAGAKFVALYVSKYITKEAQYFARARVGRRVRKIQTSRAFFEHADETEGELEFYFVAGGLTKFIFDIETRAGRIFKDVVADTQITEKSFKRGEIYPPKG